MWWFYLHCAVSIVILISDLQGNLEPTLKRWEKKLGIPVPDEVEGDKSGDEKKESL
tara:strand:- start:1040 stop:1207 length:168 start_codon:yes stop_codon:yes gene_type:complete